jgi:hypothetical protein
MQLYSGFALNPGRSDCPAPNWSDPPQLTEPVGTQNRSALAVRP